MRVLTSLLLLATLTACGQLGGALASTSPEAGLSAQGLLARALPRLNPTATPIALTRTDSPFVKDPAIANEGAPIGGKRYMTFGDLRRFYLKGFSVKAGRNPQLTFDGDEHLIDLKGLPARLDSVWAPEIVVIGDRVVLLYCAGEMPPPQPPRWKTFHLRQASLSLKAFEQQVAAGGTVAFEDQGEILTDLEPFADGDFGVIDPAFYVNPKGKAFVTYTVVRGGVPGQRYHEEFVRYRHVDPKNPGKALSADMPLYDGRGGTDDNGVAEAQDVITLKGKTYLFVSSRPGDIDQKIMIAPMPADLGKVPAGGLKPFMLPGGEPWRSNAVGSNGAAVIDGTCFIVFQGMDAKNRFTLGWTTVQF